MDTPVSSSDRTLSVAAIILGMVSLAGAALVGVSDNPPGIIMLLLGPTALLFGLLHRKGRTRESGIGQQLLYWMPRLLCIVFAAFTTLFAGDVFEEHLGFWDTALALVMHLIPTFIIVALLVLSWRFEWIGGLLFLGFGGAYIVMMWGRFSFMTYALISGPLFLIGALFLANWRQRVMSRAIPRPGA